MKENKKREELVNRLNELNGDFILSSFNEYLNGTLDEQVNLFIGECSNEEFEAFIEFAEKRNKEHIFYCNKCERAIKEEDLTQSEKQEIGYNLMNENVPSFVCSDCINKEMNEEIEVLNKIQQKVDKGIPLTNVEQEIISSPCWY